MSQGRQIGKYQVTGELGDGSFGVVYQGFDPDLEQSVAIKVCTLGDEGLDQRFAHEGQVAAGLRHENIVAVLAVDTAEDGSPYLVQELLSGADLRTLIESNAPLEPRRKIEILADVARGLAYGHARGVVHRAVHPGNVRVLADGTVKVMDFAIAKLSSAETELTRESVELGTAGYQPPEQVRGGEVDHRADVFSFGVLAYELLSGERPFRGGTLAALVYQILYKVPAPLDAVWSSCPEPLGDLVGRCLEKKPERRFPDLSEVVARLEELLAEIDAGRWPALREVVAGPANLGAAQIGEEEGEALGDFTISTSQSTGPGQRSTSSPDATQVLDGSPLATRTFDQEVLEKAGARPPVAPSDSSAPSAPRRRAVDPAAATMKIPRPGAEGDAEGSSDPDLETKAEQIRELIVAGELESAMEHLESTLGGKREDSTPSSVPSRSAPSRSAPSRSAPSRAPSAPPVPPAKRSTSAKGKDQTKLWVGIAALLAVGLAVGLLLWPGFETAPAEPTRQDEPTAAPVATVPEPVPALEGPRGAVAVRAVPWGEVVEITDGQGYVQSLPAIPLTPLRLELPPGSYVVQLAHPDHVEPQSCTVEVVEGGLASCRVTFGEIPAVDEFFRATGWWS